MNLYEGYFIAAGALLFIVLAARIIRDGRTARRNRAKADNIMAEYAAKHRRDDPEFYTRWTSRREKSK